VHANPHGALTVLDSIHISERDCRIPFLFVEWVKLREGTRKMPKFKHYQWHLAEFLPLVHETKLTGRGTDRAGPPGGCTDARRA
jgi:hypothetical protein